MRRPRMQGRGDCPTIERSMERHMNSGVTVPKAILAALSRYRDADRLYALSIDSASADLVVERWQGRETLSQGFEWWVDALSTDAGVPP